MFFRLIGAWLVLFCLIVGGSSAKADAVPAGAASLLAWNDSDPAAADRLSAIALRQNPQDARALLVRALLARSLGQLDDALAFAMAAYRSGELSALRFDAALLAADVLTRQDRFTRAQIWLRRADQIAPDDKRRTLARRSYREVASRNPLAVRLRFGVSPSSNVNNGAETTEIEIGGLPFQLDDSGLQLGGYEAETGVSLAYRLSEQTTHKTEILGEIFYRKVWLNSEAMALAPNAKGSDFDYAVVAGGLRHDRMIWPELGLTTLSGVVGQTWYGGEELALWGDAQLKQTVQHGEDRAWRFGVSFRLESRMDDAKNDSYAVGLNAEHLRLTSDGGRYNLGAFLRDTRSDSATIDNLAVGSSVARQFKRIGPVQPSIKVTAESRDYRKWVATAGGRRDNSLGLQLDFIWPDVSYYGFSPLAVFSTRRTWSNVDIYDRSEVSLGLSVVSRF
ncbi:MAG: tetratricopeptide repeat protein [Silicimonas sp.]|nr:tetratricopeptide repeat protein [Silicimonas sp.]